MIDHPITGSPDHPILSALQTFILTTIHRHGPQSDMGLWHNSGKNESLKAVIVAVGILADEKFIERTPSHKIPHGHPASAGPYAQSHGVQYWQLTQKGQQHIADVGAAAATNAQQQEVTPWI
jgi:hypothetical protein